MSVKIAESASRAIKVSVAQVDQSGYTLPTQAAGGPPPALIQQGDFVTYWPIYSSTDLTFGAVSVANLAAGTSSSTSTTVGPAAAYTAALVALFTTKANFLGVSENQFRKSQTMDTQSSLNQITVNTKDDYWADCEALLADKEVGAYVTVDGTAAGTSGAYTSKLYAQKVNFFYDATGTVQGGTACTAAYAIGRLIERAAAGATRVKIRPISQLVS